MAITISNQIENHRGIYYEYTGDGATTQSVIQHSQYARPGHTVKAFIVTAPTKLSRRSERGGFVFPEDGTAATISSAAVSGTTNRTVTVTTSAAVANATKAYCVVLFDQHTN